MNKKSLLIGFFTGIGLIITVVFILFKTFISQPDISLSKMKAEDLDGNEINFLKMKGKPIVINYWATWCVPCIEEFPDFQKVKNSLEDKVTFLMISDQNVNVIKKFKNKNSYNFNYLIATKGFEDINIRPTTYIYDKNGKLIKKYIGKINEKEFIDILNKIL